MKRVLALILCFALCLSLFPVSSFADELTGDASGEPAETTLTPEEPEMPEIPDSETVDEVLFMDEQDVEVLSDVALDDFDNGSTLALKLRAEGEPIPVNAASSVIAAGGYLPKDTKALTALSGDYEAAVAALAEGMKNYSSQVNVRQYNIAESDVVTVFSEVLNTHPELYYVNTQFSYLPDDDYVESYHLEYYDDYAYTEEAYLKAVRRAADCVKEGMSDFQKALAVHDYIAAHAEYEYSGGGYNAYDALVNGICVCHGYSLAYLAVMQYLGVDCAVVTSEAMHHAWNIVKVDGYWYHLDITWDDSSNPAREGVPGKVGHIYFLASDQKFANELGHSGWVSSFNCLSTLYDNGGFWTDCESTVVMPDAERAYYLLSEKRENGYIYTVMLCGRDILSGAADLLYSFETYWTPGGNSYWPNTVCSYLSCDDGGVLWFNSADEVYYYSLSNGLNGTVYTPPEGSQIYGLYVEGDYAVIALSDTPNAFTDVLGTTLTAPLEYTVSFDANGGTGLVLGQTKTHGETLYLTDETPTWEGHEFLGWATSNAAVEPECRSGDPFDIDADTTLYAVWRENSGSLPNYCGENLTWTLDETGTLTIIGTGKMDNYKNYSDYFAPWYSNRESIRKVIIKSGATSIGEYGFYECLNLHSIEIPDTLTRIGGYAFYGCSSLTSIEIPDKIKIIDYGTFQGCSSLTSIYISEKINGINLGAFIGCSSLTSINVSANNSRYCSVDGALFNKSLTALAVVPAGRSGEYVIPDGVTSIYDDAFYGCSGLLSVEIPDSVMYIGKSSFYGCSGLTNLEIPDNVTTICDNTFAECTGLTCIAIPSGVLSIGVSAFRKCSNLTDIEIPDSVTTIGYCAFSGCSSLTDIEIPDSVTSLGIGVGGIIGYAFYDCSALRSISLPDSITRIGGWTFGNCSSLVDIEIPDSVLSIGEFAFDDCTALKDIFYTGTQEQWNAVTIGADNDCLTNAAIHCLGDRVVYSVTLPADFSGEETAVEGSDYSFTADDTTKAYTVSATMGGAAVDVTYNGNGTYTVANVTGDIVVSAEELFEVVFKDNYYANQSYINYRFTGFKIRLYGESEPRQTNNSNNDIVLSPDGYPDGLVFEITAAKPNYNGKYYTDPNTACYVYSFIGSTMGGIGIGTLETLLDTSVVSLPYFDETEPDKTFHRWYKLDSVTGETVIKVKPVMAKYPVTVTGDAAADISMDKTTATYRSDFTFTKAEDVDIVAITAGNKVLRLNEGYVYKMTGGVTDTNTIIITGGYVSGDIVIDTAYTEDEHESCGSKLRWYFDGQTGALTVRGTGRMYDFNIGQQPWRGVRSQIKSVEIAQGVTYVGDYAFDNCRNLESITLCGTLTELGDYAFAQCPKLTAVEIPDSVKKLGTWTFYMCSALASVNIPDGVKTLGESLFYNCSALTSIDIPDSVTVIGDNAFAVCRKLAAIKIPQGVTEIGEYAFYSCHALTEITIPESVSDIGKNAFERCSALTEVNLPADIDISESMFYNCDALESVNVPEGASVGECAFADCGSLTEINVSENNARYSSVGGVLFNKSGSELIQFPGGISGEYTLPASVTSIADNAFLGCYYLTGVTLNEGLTMIGESAFYSCRAIESINIPDSVNSIGVYAFFGCSKLTEITLPATLETIAEGSFYYCSALESIGIPVSVTAVGASAFFRCTALASVYYSGTKTQWNAVLIGEKNEALTNAQLICAIAEYTVSYDANGGTGNIASQIKTAGVPLTLTDEIPALDGSTFLGWASDKDAAEPEYSSGDLYTADADVTLYAVWQPNGVLGDVTDDGDVTMADVVRLNRAVLGKYTLNEKQHLYGDVDFDGDIAISDVVKLNRFVLKKLSSLELVESNALTVFLSSFGESVISVDSVRAEGGESVEVPVRISGNKGIAGLSLDIILSEGLSLESVTAGEMLGSISTGGNTVNWYSGTGENVTADGVLMVLKLRVAENAEGVLPVSVALNEGKECNLVGKNNINVAAEFVSGSVTFVKAPAISTQPLSCTVKAKTEAVFTVEAEGEGLSYRWQVSKDGGATWTNILNSTGKTAQLSFTAKAAHDGRLYRCIISSNGMTVTSSPALLTVK